MNTGGPAFPIGSIAGMSLRDYFAAKAMLALCVETMKASKLNTQLLASNAYAVADAMLSQREKS
jgi:hypothetical protein